MKVKSFCQSKWIKMKLKLNRYFQFVKLNGKAGANYIVTGDQPKPRPSYQVHPSIPGEVDKVLDLFLIF